MPLEHADRWVKKGMKERRKKKKSVCVCVWGGGVNGKRGGTPTYTKVHMRDGHVCVLVDKLQDRVGGLWR